MKKPPPAPFSCPGSHGAILDSITEGVFTVDLEWKVSYFNRAAEEITGIPREEALGRPCWEVFRASICEEGCGLRWTMEEEEPTQHLSAYIVRQDGEKVPIAISTALLRNDRGEVIGGVETFRDLSVEQALRKELSQRYTFGDIISKDPRMQELFGVLARVALTDTTVLIEGESGTGKELFARAIHSLSPRREGPFIVVNCGALPDTLLESELFGHVAGAFTDARKDRLGRFALADRGTVFLDEIGDVSPALQVRLLRVLQERSFEPLGSTRTVKVDVRVLAATNKHLADLVREGSFREDLFYRINVLPLRIPPLREREGDIPLLVEHFMERFNRLQGKQISRMAPEAMALLLKHSFPGNVRELMNIIEHTFVLCPGEVILIEHLPDHLRPAREAPRPPRSMAEAEARVISQALARNDHNRSTTALELGMHKTTLWRKMKKLGLGAK